MRSSTPLTAAVAPKKNAPDAIDREVAIKGVRFVRGAGDAGHIGRILRNQGPAALDLNGLRHAV